MFAPASMPTERPARFWHWVGAGRTTAVPMILQTLVDGAAVVGGGARLHGDGRVPLADVAYDSRAVTPGTLFFCVPGEHADGHEREDDDDVHVRIRLPRARDDPRRDRHG